MRQIILDTETTGLEVSQGHRIIEIGAVEMIDRRVTRNNFHVYINPEREVDEGAISVHGITNEFLVDKPLFSAIAEDFIAFVADSELVIHNAAFDIGFLNNELSLLDDIDLSKALDKRCPVVDTLAVARDEFPGQRNNLDALCRRFGIDNSNRTLHGALLDAEILADVYLLLTGGQINLLDDANAKNKNAAKIIEKLSNDLLHKVKLSDQDNDAHKAFMEMLAKKE